MAKTHVEHLLLGGGLASATAAETLRHEGAKGGILILSEESISPYYRPFLSKEYLVQHQDPSKLQIFPESFYAQQDIRLMLNTTAVKVDTQKKFIATASGQVITYDKLLIATGAKPKPIHIPGAELDGVYSLRRRSEGEAIRHAGLEAKRAVVMGGSFLGMEIAMSLRHLGLDVTIVEIGNRVLQHLESQLLSNFFHSFAEAQGLTIHLLDDVIAIEGDDNGNVRSVTTRGGKVIPTDMVVVSIGVDAATSFLYGTGIDLDRGRVLVDEFMATNVPGVFAAGDVTTFYDPVFRDMRHIEHADNAMRQGRIAARNMLGKRQRYEQVSYFFCEVGDLSFSALGITEDADEWIGRGSLEDRSFAMFYLREGIVRGYFSMGRPASETRTAEGLIRYRVNVSDRIDRIADANIPLDDIPTQNVLVLQGGGALGAFETGVVQALEEEGIYPDIVAGVSIGAINGAVIAGNPRNPTEALTAFWKDLTVTVPGLLPEDLRRTAVSMQILAFGVPKFFRPRWLPPALDLTQLPLNWTSYYDTSPMKALLAKYVDFSKLKNGPVRLLVSAVNVTTAELEVFDSYVDDLTPDHILASGSLPPSFPWTEINGKSYWDGGIISNSPLDIVLDRCGPEGKQVYAVDLFASQKPLPQNLIEVRSRLSEIIYSERVRNDIRVREVVSAYRGLIEHVLSHVEEETAARIRQRPYYIQLMGDGAPMKITRFLRVGTQGESSSRDFDFSDFAISENHREGYELARKTLQELREQELEELHERELESELKQPLADVAE
ncbi:FAD-dependent oxidoreductase [Pseudochelatococcus contaminans]|uniref:NTE family protein n=1 Tax=Pseudochelatococcus contaminans TaxID=1538103 RepID=A0A7W5Z4E4_9HYPH|nr:FAD-dependent oxidoreductase [Pseudochelatococcus contaminans]MBB3809863.1 NTE family protein [Pseudochelatococcus contaminans]